MTPIFLISGTSTLVDLNISSSCNSSEYSWWLLSCEQYYVIGTCLSNQQINPNRVFWLNYPISWYSCSVIPIDFELFLMGVQYVARLFYFILFWYIEDFSQQWYFKICEVNLLWKYFLIVANICPTTRGGNGWTEGSTCKFPFNYRGQMYDTCITLGENAPWCYTVDKPTRTTYGVPWGYCSGDSCPMGTLSYSIIHIHLIQVG